MRVSYNGDGTFQFTGKDGRIFKAKKLIARGQWIYLSADDGDQRIGIQEDDVDLFIEMLSKAVAL